MVRGPLQSTSHSTAPLNATGIDWGAHRATGLHRLVHATTTMKPHHLTFAGLFPHPPILVPAVAGRRHAACRDSWAGGRRFASRLVASRAERVVIISPHAPRQDTAFGLWSGSRLQGDLGRFGAPDEGVDVANDEDLVKRLQHNARSAALDTWRISPGPLDHGTVIPLWFLAAAGWRGPTVVVSLPRRVTNTQLETCGRWLQSSLEDAAQPYALVASGDMTHRALPEAPAGYHPRAVEFDEALRDLIRRGRLDRIAQLDPELRRLAAEDAADTSLIVAAACDYRADGCEVVSYEHPFGVGYLVAVFYDRTLDTP